MIDFVPRHAAYFFPDLHILILKLTDQKCINDREAAEIAEQWAVDNLEMEKAKQNQKGFDGTLPDGRKLQVKSKKHGAHRDSGTYIDLNEGGICGNDAADDLLIVFVDYASGEVKRRVGPVPIKHLMPKTQKYYRWTVKQIQELERKI